MKQLKYLLTNVSSPPIRRVMTMPRKARSAGHTNDNLTESLVTSREGSACNRCHRHLPCLPFGTVCSHFGDVNWSVLGLAAIKYKGCKQIAEAYLFDLILSFNQRLLSQYQQNNTANLSYQEKIRVALEPSFEKMFKVAAGSTLSYEFSSFCNLTTYMSHDFSSNEIN